MDRTDDRPHPNLFTRRRFLSLCAGGLASAVGASRAAAQGQLTVALYGGRFGEGIREGSIKAFQQATGGRVLEEQGVSMVTLGKLRQQKGNPAIDVAWIDGGVSELAQAEGLVDAIDLGALPHAKDLFPEAVHRDKGGKAFALSGGFYAIGMSYNKDTIKTPPASWKDLWRPEYAGKVTTASPVNATWPNWFAHMATVFGGNLDNVDAVLNAMKQLKVAAYWDAAGQSDNLFQSGEAQVGVHIHGNSWGLRDKGLPFVFVVPAEGVVAGDIRVHLVKGAKNRDLALKYIDAVISPAGQKGLLDYLSLGPGSQKAEIPPKIRERMPYGPSGSMKNLVIPDWFAINERKPKWIERWNKEVLGKA
jgi:putative spermidine/putrescine transport system substrate-binding protein